MDEMCTEKAKEQNQTLESTIASKNPPASSRKAEANRLNALESTGPRTPLGRRTVAKNALKRGFFSKWLLIPHPDWKEDPNEYAELCLRSVKTTRPASFVEKTSN